MYIMPDKSEKYKINYKEAKFQVDDRVIITRITDGDEAAAPYENYVGKVVGHALPYAFVLFGDNMVIPVLERDLEKWLG